MMFGAIYLALLPLLAYLSGNRDSIKVLLLFCAIILADLIVTDFLKISLGDFFLGRAVVDLSLLLVLYHQQILSIKKWVISSLVFTSLLVNIYLCFELGNVFLYRQWEIINLVLCELIFATLIISDKAFEMLRTIRTYIYGAIAAVGLFLLGMLKYLSYKNSKLENELKTEKHNTAVKDAVVKKEKDIQQALSDVQKESQKVHDANTKNRINKINPSVGDSFNDPRLD